VGVAHAGGPHHRSCLARVVRDPDDFAAHAWGRQAVLSRAADLPRSFADLLDQQAVDELVSRRGLRTPFLRVARAGSTLPERDFTAGAGAGAGIADQVSDDLLVRLFADGATLVLQGLHRLWSPLIDFSQGLAADLGHPVQANAYVTPPANRGFAAHYDVHDVFVLQTHGRKRWQIHEPVHPSPLRDQPWDARRTAVEDAAVAEPFLDEVLEPGDCLYLPRGWLHAATALGEVSTHVTVGVHTWTRHALAEQLLRSALADLAGDESLRGSLPLGVDVGSPAELAGEVDAVRNALVRAVGAVGAERVTQDLQAKARSAQRAAPMGPLAQHEAAAELVPGEQLVLRQHLLADVVQRGGGWLLVSRSGEVPLQAADVEVVRNLLRAGQMQVQDVTLARRLVLAGVTIRR